MTRQRAREGRLSLLRALGHTPKRRWQAYTGNILTALFGCAQRKRAVGAAANRVGEDWHKAPTPQGGVKLERGPHARKEQLHRWWLLLLLLAPRRPLRLLLLLALRTALRQELQPAQRGRRVPDGQRPGAPLGRLDNAAIGPHGTGRRLHPRGLG
jgi:hypothetical protein